MFSSEHVLCIYIAEMLFACTGVCGKLFIAAYCGLAYLRTTLFSCIQVEIAEFIQTCTSVHELQKKVDCR